MAARYPTIVFTEEGMREGMQIEDAAIPIEAKVALLDALSETGLRRIVVGSFVSPKYTPQMARMTAVQKFRPTRVTYRLALNEKGVERAKKYAPPLTIERSECPGSSATCATSSPAGTPTARRCRRWRRGQDHRRSQERRHRAGIGTNATFGSNFLGDFTVDMTMKFLEKQHELWDAAGLKVTAVSVGDPMGWCHPVKVEEIFTRVKKTWPDITEFRAHLHNSRGMALTSTYAAITCLDATDTLHVDGTIGGVGGCPYCGNGQATGLAATEDLMHMLEGMGIETGVDLDKLIDCVWLLEETIGRMAWGVSRTGPRPPRWSSATTRTRPSWKR